LADQIVKLTNNHTTYCNCRRQFFAKWNI